MKATLKDELLSIFSDIIKVDQKHRSMSFRKRRLPPKKPVKKRRDYANHNRSNAFRNPPLEKVKVFFKKVLA